MHNNNIHQQSMTACWTKQETEDDLKYYSPSFIRAKAEPTTVFQQSITSSNDIVIGPYDILCGRHKTAFNNIGNRRFRVTLSLNMARYIKASKRSQKSEVIMSVTRFLREAVGARFLKKKGKGFVELDEKEARSKVGHALRDMSVAQQQQQSLKVNFDDFLPRDDDEESLTVGGPFRENVLGDLLEEFCCEGEDDGSLEPLPAVSASIICDNNNATTNVFEQNLSGILDALAEQTTVFSNIFMDTENIEADSQIRKASTQGNKKIIDKL
jgi:hypothetical protein